MNCESFLVYDFTMYDIFKGFYDTIGSEDFSITKLFWCSTILRVKKSYVISKNQNQEIAYLLRRFGLGFHYFDYFLSNWQLDSSGVPLLMGHLGTPQKSKIGNVISRWILEGCALQSMHFSEPIIFYRLWMAQNYYCNL